MPAQSQQQQKLFGLALSVKRGETPRSEASKEVLGIVDSMTEKQIEDFAGTSHSDLPKKVESVLRELVRAAIKDNVVADTEIVKEHKDCGCGCKGTTVGGCNTSLTEGLFQNIMKGVKKGSGPFTMVVIKDNKVVKQVRIDTPQAVPASYTTLEKQYPNSRIRIEDATGKMVFGEGVVNEADVVGKTVFSDGKGKLHFGYYKTDDAVEFVDYKTWKKLNFKDVSKGDTNKDRVVNSILRNQKQFNKKVDYNMWAKKTNPSFEEKMDWFIKNGWISNITKAGIKEGVESVNESSVEIGDTVFLKSANKIATVIDRMGRSVTVKTGDGKKVKTVINNIKTLAEEITEKLDNKQLGLLKYAYKDIKRINPSEPAYGRLVKHLDTLSKSELQQLADAGINFISLLAKNRLMRSESVNEAASRTAMEIGGLTGMNKDAVQKFVDTHNLDIEKVFQFVKKGKLSDRMDLVSAIAGKPGNPIQKKMIKMFGESVDESRGVAYWKANKQHAALLGQKFVDVASDDDIELMASLKEKFWKAEREMKQHMSSMDNIFKRYKIPSSKGVEK